MTTANSTTAPVEFVKQGGHAHTGTAIGRKGKALLITYRIAPGCAVSDDGTRERWIPGKRILSIDEALRAALPRYAAVPTCKGVRFPESITHDEYTAAREAGTWRCSLCGKDHGALTAWEYIDGEAIGRVFGKAKLVSPPALAN